MNKHIKIFFVFAILIFTLMSIKFTKEYYENENIKKLIFQEEAKALNNFIIAFRKTYQDIFVEQDIPITNKSINFLPIHSLSRISEEFSTLAGKQVVIRTISDNPRNPNNMANEKEMPILQEFKKTKSQEPYFEIKGSKLLEITPLYIEQNCIKCHGKKEETLATIQANYSGAFDYKLGDFRGAISLEISKHDIFEIIDKNFYMGIFIATLVYIFCISAIYFLIRKIHNNEREYTKKLEAKIDVQKDEINNQEQLLLQQSKLALMGEMIGNIAHQWRQPLSIISTCASGMKLQKEVDILDDNIFYDSCEMIINQSHYLSQTIDDFRSYLQSNKEKNIFKLDEIISNSISIVSPAYKSCDITLIYNNDFLDIEIETYNNELVQVLLNILNNAKDAIIISSKYEKRLVFINVELKDDFVSINILDNGGGIPKEIIDKIFEPYFTTKHKSQGTGLGLFMSYKIVNESLNGLLKVQNKEFEYEGEKYFGAEFKIELVSLD